MINQQSLTAIQEVLDTQIEQTLSNLGAGEMNSVAYDTAWIARLAPSFPGHGFDQALAWLRQHQHADGSWGAEELHYHDRVICTLSAIIALHTAGRSAQDEHRIRRGAAFLWRANGQLHHDANDTVGFPVLVVSLINEAITLGLDVPRDIYQNAAIIEKKLNLLDPDPQLWRYSTMIFSLEAVRTYFPDEPSFLEANGSVGASPAATASVLLQSGTTSRNALGYLQNVIQSDGGVPNASPIDTFEIAWALNHFRTTKVLGPDYPGVRRILDILWAAWSPQKGLSFSSYFPVPDLDCTAAGFSVLRWGGYPVYQDVFGAYEEEDHFCCYPGETDPSLTVNIRALAALRMVRHGPHTDEWTDKIVKMLRRRALEGFFWFDKWHMSPYYPICAAIYSLDGVADDLIEPCVKWIIKTQHQDGSWGYYSRPTSEETAYCLQALLYWDQTVERIDSDVLDTAASYLLRHLNDKRLTSLWLAKCSYTPISVVRSAILSALYSYATR